MARLEVQETRVDATNQRAARPQVTPTAQWSPGLDAFRIHVASSRSVPAGSFGEASRGSQRRLGTSGALASTCVAPASYPLQIRFYVDAEGLARPAPFAPPAVTASVTFTAEGERAPAAERKVADAAPTYTGPGRWLRTSFGDVLPTAAAGSGTLAVVAELADPGTRTTVRYTDQIPCRLEPCA